MADTQIYMGVPPTIQDLVQKELVQRAFHDNLQPALLFRSEAIDEEWEANTGTEVFITRRGEISPKTNPLQGQSDPSESQETYEQWPARLQRWGDATSTHMPTNAVASANKFLSGIKALGISAGRTMNRVARNALFQAYLAGHTVLVDAALSTDTSIHVASINGFRDVVVPGTTVRPVGVSSLVPLPIVIGALGVFYVIGAEPDNSNDPIGPGTLLLSAAIGGAGAAARTAVLSSERPSIVRCGGGLSIDALSAGDTVALQDLIAAVGRLRKNNVPPHADGFYHGHMPIEANTQVFADTPFQRAQTAQYAGPYYQEAWVGRVAGTDFGLNNESPDVDNSGPTTSTGTNALYSQDIGAETRNESGINVGRIIITGAGALHEMWLDENKHYMSEAGVAGKVGTFNVVNGGVVIDTKHIRLVLRAPQNVLMDKVTTAWSCSTCFPTPSDRAVGNASRHKRAVVLEYARD